MLVLDRIVTDRSQSKLSLIDILPSRLALDAAQQLLNLHHHSTDPHNLEQRADATYDLPGAMAFHIFHRLVFDDTVIGRMHSLTQLNQLSDMRYI